MDARPPPAGGWHHPAASVPARPAGVDWLGLYQQLMQVVACLAYGGVLVLFVLIFTWPRPAPADSPETHLARQQRSERALAAKRRGPISEPCRLLLASFADAFADFMACSMKASRPLAVCTRCAPNRYPLELAYRNIVSGTNPADADCHLELLDQDDVHVIVFHLRYYKSVMEQNRCDQCVTRLGYGGYRVDEGIVEYRRRHDAFRACVEKNGDRTAPDGVPAVCEKCASLLLAQARQLEVVSGRRMHPAGSLCADVEDMVNVTSRMWRCHGCREPGEVTGESGWTAHAPLLIGLLVVTAFYGVLGRRAQPRPPQWPQRRAAPPADPQEEDEEEDGSDVDYSGDEDDEDAEEGGAESQSNQRPLRANEYLRPPGPGEVLARRVRVVHPEEIRPPPLPEDARQNWGCQVM